MGLRIFIIDDEESIRDTFKWYLEDKGHEVIVAEEPAKLAICHGCDGSGTHPCGDILLIDFQMPKMTGLEFLQQLQKRGCKLDPENKYIMSGNLDAIDMVAVKSVGCHLLQKPVTLDKIDQIVEEVQKRVSADRS